MLEQAIDAFDRAEYDDAIYYADLTLRKDPRNDQAAELRDAAFRSGREQVRSEYVEAKREQFARWKEQLESYRVPWNDPVTLPDPDDWAHLDTERSSFVLSQFQGCLPHEAEQEFLRRVFFDERGTVEWLEAGWTLPTVATG